MNKQELIERYLKMIKLKYIIKRINELEPSAKQYWIDEILKELGSDYGRLKYRSGYEQGKIEGMVERETVKVPQLVADWYEKNKDDFETSLFQCIYELFKKRNDSELNEFENWVIDENTKPFQILVNMHQFGYEVEEKKRYTVVMKETKQPLYYNAGDKKLFFSLGGIATNFTRKQLEEAGFGWVFDCPGIEIEEVE